MSDPHAAHAAVTVAIACYDERRWESILAAVRSVQGQTVRPAAVVVSVDHNPDLARRLRAELDGVDVVENEGARGASGNRNRAVREVRTPVVAFLDDDERAEPDWLERLLEPLADPAVAGTGGRYTPAWETGEPAWFPPEWGWAVGAHYEGLPTTTAPVRGVWSGSMAVRTEAFRAVGGFREDFGKVGDVPLPEDTDLCLRVTAAGHGGWRYVPDAVVHHEVPAARSTRGFLVRRSLVEAKGKVLMRALAGDLTADVEGGALGAERGYLTSTVPRGVLRDAGAAARAARSGDLATARRSADRAAMSVAATAAAALGAAQGAGVLVSRAVGVAPSGRPAPGTTAHRGSPARIFVQHSGYDLRNTGDSAMLQACVRRLQARWPDAEVVVLCYDADQLARLLPGVTALGPVIRHLPGVRALPRKARLGGEHGVQALAPFVPVGRRRPAGAPLSVREALATSDVVVATGGGYVCDTFWWHAVGVLSCLYRAHRDGKPNALVGQGIGPLHSPVWRGLAAPALRRVDLLTLREGVRGPDLLVRMGVWTRAEAEAARAGRLVTTGRGGLAAVTGDDALATALHEVDAAGGSFPATGRPVIGVNVRLGADSGIDDAPALGAALWRTADELGADLVTVPVSYYDHAPDEASTRAALGPAPAGGTEVELRTGDTRQPEALARTAGGCRVVVTGSYHAAVFALASGTPVVGLVANDYYRYKFGGLAELYPGLVTPFPLDGPDLPGRLRDAVRHAWDLPQAARPDAVERTRRYVARAQEAFDAWADEAQARLSR